VLCNSNVVAWTTTRSGYCARHNDQVMRIEVHCMLSIAPGLVSSVSQTSMDHVAVGNRLHTLRPLSSNCACNPPRVVCL
jgi:hypothetical protein